MFNLNSYVVAKSVFFFISLAATYINMQSNLTFIRIVQLIIFKKFNLPILFFLKLNEIILLNSDNYSKILPLLPHTPMLTKTFLSDNYSEILALFASYYYVDKKHFSLLAATTMLFIYIHSPGPKQHLAAMEKQTS